MALPDSLQRSLKATATVTIAELRNEGMAAANNPAEWPYAQISEILDERTCPLCLFLDGKIVAVGSPEYARYRSPSHIGCRRTLAYVSKDEPNVVVDFEEPSAELLRKHGHYHLDPNRHAEYRIPAEPAGRHLIVRRVKNETTGERETRLDWAPWFDQVPQWKRELILQARTAPADALPGLLAKLGITDPEDAEQYAAAVRLGLRDRLAGWVTTSIVPPRATLELVQAAEAQLAQLKTHEEAVVWDAQGQEILRKKGGADYVEFTPAELASFRDGVLTHNHPKGGSFSPADWNIAVRHDLQEIRATGINDAGERYTYVLSRPPQGWNKSAGEVLALLDRLDDEVYAEISKQVLAGKIPFKDAERRHWHEVATRAAEELGWDYRQIRIESE